MTKRLSIIIFVIVFTLTACSHFIKPSPILDSAHPELVKKSGIETIVILGTNDLHGNIAQLSLLSSYIKQLRNEYSSRLIWLDAGSHFQGTLISDQEKGTSITTFFNELGLHASVLGAHEFDFGIETLNQRIRDSNFYYLSTNLREELPLIEKHGLISAGSLKVGVIGLTSSDALNPLHTFQQSKKLVLEEAQELRENGAQIVVLTTDIGVQCAEERPPNPLLHKPNETINGCHYRSQLPQLIKYLPKGTLDAVVTGNTHTLVHHWIGGIPVIQSGSFGKHLHAIYLFYDTNKKKLLTEKTLIEGPIPVQEGYVFHGKMMEKDPQIELLFQPQIKAIEEAKNTIIGKAPHTISDVGRITAEALLSITESDYAMVTQGLIQRIIPGGAVSMEEIYGVIPYANTYAQAKISGSQLQSIVRKYKNGKSRVILASPKPIFRNKIYRVAMPDFIAKSIQIPPERIEWRNEPIRDALVQYIKNHPNLLR
jgi:2',3'-cyclic-nucleotide 2'-phosphodiesterase/3'-nucleotidase